MPWKRVSLHQLRALSLLDLERQADAEALFEAILDRNPEHMTAIAVWCEGMRQLGRRERLHEQIDRWRQERPEEPKLYEIQLNLTVQAGDDAGAERILHQAINKLRPPDRFLRHLIAFLQSRERRLEAWQLLNDRDDAGMAGDPYGELRIQLASGLVDLDPFLTLMEAGGGKLGSWHLGSALRGLPR